MSIPPLQLVNTIIENVCPNVHQTPVLTSRILNEMTGASLFFKCENFQKMGAFKMRGAVAALSQLTENQKQKGVVTHSSGNFAQALSLAAKQLNIPAYIVMPQNAPRVKIEGVQRYGGIITKVPATQRDREAGAAKITAETGATFIHPSNDLNVILGNATAGYELINQTPHLEVLIAPVGGGGLLAGTAIAGHYFSPKAIIKGAEPATMNDAARSLQSGIIQTNPPKAYTIADGLRTTLGDINFPIIKDYVSEILVAEETEIIEAMKLIWNYLKIIVESSCALPLAVVLKNKPAFKNKHIGIIISGGNVDLDHLPF